ncbi:MAG: ABC transporter ATP-binding protein [Proteobacteria bacterium]|nr:ABC transporter ATP-binding protein [Pseudomonadota bacterium]
MSCAADSGRSGRAGGRRRWLWHHARPQLPALCLVLALALLASALSITLPYLSRLIIDRGLLGRDPHALLILCGAIVGLAALSLAVAGLMRWIYVRASAGILFALREDVYRHLLALAPEFYRRRAVGDLVTRLDGDVAEVQRFSTDSVLACLNSLLLLVGSVAVMGAMSWRLTVVAAAVLPFQLLVRHVCRPLLTRRTRAVREQTGEIAQFLFETLGAAKSIQAATAEAHEQLRLRALNRGFLERLLSLQLVSYGTGAAAGLLSHLSTAAVFIYGGYAVIAGSLTLGTLVAFVAYMARSAGSAGSLLGLYTAYQRAAVSFERVEELLAEPVNSRPRLAPGVIAGQNAGYGLRPRPADNAISLRSVSLGRAVCGNALLADCSLEIAAGSKIVIHGASGVGKSTLIDALRCFVPLDSGAILLGGVDISECDPALLRRAVEVLVPDPVIFRGSILDNLRFGNFDASEASLVDAARRVGLEDHGQLAAGLMTAVASGGAGLSAGQRQRLALARVLLRQPEVLILDEALTHLHAAAAQELLRLIDTQFSRCTRIIVSHSAASIPQPDMVLELRDRRLLQAPRALRA